MGKLILVYYNGGTMQGALFDNTSMMVSSIISLVVLLAFYVFRSIALITMAGKDESLRGKRWLVLIPFVWPYFASRLSGQYTSFFGKKVGKFGIVVMSIGIFANALLIARYIIAFLPLVRYFYNGGDVYIGQISQLVGKDGIVYYPYNYAYAVVESGIQPYLIGNANTIRAISQVFGIVGGISLLVFELALVFVYIDFFKAYWPEHMFLGSILSVLGLFPIFAFAIRKRAFVDYDEFIRQRYESMGINIGGGVNPRSNEDPFDDGKNKSNNDDPFDDGKNKK